MVVSLQKIISSGFDAEQLCIVEGKHCWCVFVDVLVLESDGNDLDAAVLASRAALKATKLPGVSVEEDAETATESLSLSYDPNDAKSLQVESIPVAVTLCQIAQSSVDYFVDPSRAEQECALTRLTVAVDPRNGKVLFVQKASEGAIEPSVLLDMLSVACETAQSLQ